MPVLDQDEIDQRLAALHGALSKMIFTAARDWHRSIRIDREDRDLLVGVLNLVISQRNLGA